MKILLVNPNKRMSNDGFRLIAALLRREGHQLQIITIPNQGTDDISDEKLRMLGEFTTDADLVMMSVYSIYEQHAARLTKYLKSIRPDRLVIWGGPHCIGSAEKSLLYADGVCYSEGDIAVTQFVRLLESGSKDYLETPNMAFRVNGSVQKNPLLPLFDDLDSLPFYDYSFENEWVFDQSFVPVDSEIFAKYAPMFPFKVPTLAFLSSRGCPHDCSYCANIRYLKMYKHTKIRWMSINRLMSELKYTLAKLPNINHVCIGDDDFFARSESEIADFVTQYKTAINLPCVISMSSNTYSKNKFDEFSKLDKLIIEIGVQSASKRILETVFHRHISLDKTKKVLKEISPFLDNGNIKLLCDFIIDNPYETRDDIILNYKFIAGLHKNILLGIFSLSFFPGSELYDRAIQDKFISEDGKFSARNYASRQIKYQINYPMLLFLCWESLFFTRRLPRWMILFPASKPVRFLMRGVPRPVMAWFIRKIPAVLRMLVNKFISRNKKNRERLQTVSKSSF